MIKLVSRLKLDKTTIEKLERAANLTLAELKQAGFKVHPFPIVIDNIRERFEISKGVLKVRYSNTFNVTLENIIGGVTYLILLYNGITPSEKIVQNFIRKLLFKILVMLYAR